MDEETKFQKSTGALISDKDQELESLRSEVGLNPSSVCVRPSVRLHRVRRRRLILFYFALAAADRRAAGGERRGQDPAVGRADAGEGQGSAAGPRAQPGAKADGNSGLGGRRRRSPAVRWVENSRRRSAV